MNAVSTREAIGSAVNASAAGNAILAISRPSSSIFKTDLHIWLNTIQVLASSINTQPKIRQPETPNYEIKGGNIDKLDKGKSNF